MAVNVYFGLDLKQSRGKKSMGRRVWRLWGAVVAVCLMLGAGARADDAAPLCSAVRSHFETRGMLSSVDIQDAANSDGGGLCSARGCCGDGAKARLSSSAKQQLEAALRADLTKLSMVLAARAHRFDEFFKGLLQQSKQEFHEMFKRTYGMIYERHSYVFTELFAELERYYTSGDVDLVQLMDKFFVVLYQKMFTVLNSQYNFDDKYLQCVSEHMRETQPFDDVPHKLSIQLRRAFVATRTFQKALQAGAEVAKNMNEIGVSAECATAWARMRWCGACGSGGGAGAGAAVPPACSRYCINVVRGCLPLHADLAHHWDSYVDAVDKVSDRLLGPFNIAMVVEPIDIKISEAIMNFQEHSQDISQRIFASCGKPVLGSVPANTPAGPFFAPKRDRRSLPEFNSIEIFNQDSNSDLDDFEIEASYESILSKHPFLKRSMKLSEEYDIGGMKELAEKAEERQRFLEYMKGQINSIELESYRRPRRDADPEPAGKGSKEIDFEPYNFEGGSRGGKRKGKKPTGISKAANSKEVSGDAGGASAGGAGGGGGGGGGEVLERLVRESRARVRNTRKYWSHLPYVLCNDDDVAASPSPDVRCYNGTQRAPYLPALAGEGMTALATNPEVREAPPSKTAVLLSAQETLRTITTKLKNAYNGLDVDWRDYAEDSASLFYGSGSGSGEADDDIPDDDEDRHRPYDEDFPASGHGPITDEEEDTETHEPAVPVPAEPPAEPPYTPSVVGPPPNTHNVNMKDASQERTDDYVPQIEDFSTKVRKVEYEKPVDTQSVQEAPTAGASRTEMSLQRALISYLFPIVCAWFGGIVNDLV